MKIKHRGEDYWAYDVYIDNEIVGAIEWSHNRKCWIVNTGNFVDSRFEGFNLRELRKICEMIPKLRKDYDSKKDAS